jgi:hypothetical protein
LITIKEYELNFPEFGAESGTNLSLPYGFTVLSFQFFAGKLFMYALIDDTKDLHTEKFVVTTSGVDMGTLLGSEPYSYKSTVVGPNGALHINGLLTTAEKEQAEKQRALQEAYAQQIKAQQPRQNIILPGR